MRSDTAARRDLARALDRIKRLDPRAAELAQIELERFRRQAARYRAELRECQALVARVTASHPAFAVDPAPTNPSPTEPPANPGRTTTS